MSEEKNNKSIWLLVILGLIALVLILTAEIIYNDVYKQISENAPEESYKNWKLAAGFFRELGFAFCISIVIYLIIESSLKQRESNLFNKRIQDISENVHKGVWGRRFPKAIIDEVEASLLVMDVYRTNLEIEYTFSEPSPSHPREDEFHFHIDSTVRYKLHNSRNSKLKHDIRATVEKPFDYSEEKHQKLEIKKLEIRKPSNQELIFELDNSSGINNYIDTTKDDDEKQHHLCLRYTIELEPHQEVSIIVQSSLIKSSKDLEVWESFIPTENLTLTVGIPDNFYINCHSAHSLKPQSQAVDGNRKKWVINGGVLPTQSIIFWWRRKDGQ